MSKQQTDTCCNVQHLKKIKIIIIKIIKTAEHSNNTVYNQKTTLFTHTRGQKNFIKQHALQNGNTACCHECSEQTPWFQQMASFGSHCPALPCPALPCPALHHTALPCTTLPCPALPCTTLPCPALPYPAPHCSAPHCPALPCTTLHCTV